MDRTDPLDDAPALTHRGPGHAPALWLALPLLTGCLLAGYAEPARATTLPLGCLGLALALATASRAPRIWMVAAAVAGTGLGATWHSVRAARRTPWTGASGQADLFVEVGRVETFDGARWRMVGWVQTGPPDTARRRVQAEGEAAPPARGSLQVVSGLLRACGERDDPREDWRRSQGITLRMSRARVAATLEPPGRIDAWLARAAAGLETGLAELAWEDPRGASLLAATLLGRTRLLEPTDREAFAATGTLHLFAISGLHIAGMALALAWLGRRARLEPRLAGVIALGLLGLYVEVTGGTPSARRAWIMAACILACTLSRRRANPVQGLALAGALTLALDPEAAQDAGFQLSYASVAGILLAGGPAARAVARPGLAERLTPASARSPWQSTAGWLRTKLAEGLCISVAASTAATAITLGVFGALCPGGVAANLVLVPLSGPPVVLGMVSVALTPLPAADTLRLLVNGLAAAWLHGMAWLASWLAQVPGMAWPAAWRWPEAGAATSVAVLLTLLLQPREPAGWRLLLRPLVVLIAGLLLGAELA